MSIDSNFPKLSSSGYRITSSRDTTYNCIAWAAGVSDRWWQPDPVPGYYWPLSEPRDYSITALVNAYRTLGYEVCDGPELESGFKKIAIYAIDGEYQHAARQVSDGWWASKLGKNIDIEHSLEALEGPTYGTAVTFLRRAM